MPFSEAINNLVLDNFVTNTLTWTRVQDDLFVGLSSTAPGVDGQTATEPTTGAYARIQIPAARWTAAATAALNNTTEESYVVATAPGWGAGVIHMIMWDDLTASAAANFLGFVTLTVQPKTVGEGDTAKWAISALDIVLAGAV